MEALAQNDSPRWEVLGSKCVYTSPWVDLWIDDVRLPGGSEIEHHVIKFPNTSVGTVLVDERDRVLLIWRHRHIPNTWGWEIPAGWGRPNEEPADAAVREVIEETGYRPEAITPMTAYKPLAGISTMHYQTFIGTKPTRVGDPANNDEGDRVEWIPLEYVPRLISVGHVTDGPSLTALACYLGVFRG